MDVAEVEADRRCWNNGSGKKPALRPQVEQLRDAPVEEDVDEDEDRVGDGDGEEIGDAAAESEKLCA